MGQYLSQPVTAKVSETLSYMLLKSRTALYKIILREEGILLVESSRSSS